MSIGAYDVQEYQDLANADIEFKYDGNGNLISDLDRKIATIRYNLLNLPDTIQFENGNQIVNTYNASGRKLKTQYFTVREPVVVPLGGTLQLTYERDSINESGTVYDGQFEYPYDKSKRLAGDPLIYRVHHAEGYVERLEVRRPTNWTRSTYNYYRRDHLGNNCAVWDATNDTTLQKTVYYASGLPLSVSSGQSVQPYKYNGKEFIEMHGLDVTDLGNRSVYNALQRFTSIDRFAEKTPWQSPYVFAGNNSINYVDLNGDSISDPLDNMKVRNDSKSNTFGMVRKRPDGSPKPHQGIDYYAEEGTSVYAVEDGQVVLVQDDGNQGYGLQLILKFTNEDGEVRYAQYAHLSEVLVEKESEVCSGDEIGKTGTSGNAEGMKGGNQHLHFENRDKPILGKGLSGRQDPNKIVKTKFEIDANGKVVKIKNKNENNKNKKR